MLELSVWLYLTCITFVLSTNDRAYPAGNEAENLCAILSETAHLLKSLVLHRTSMAMCMCTIVICVSDRFHFLYV